MKKLTGGFLMVNLVLSMFAFVFILNVGVVVAQGNIIIDGSGSLLDDEAGGVLDFIEGEADNLPSSLLTKAEANPPPESWAKKNIGTGKGVSISKFSKLWWKKFHGKKKLIIGLNGVKIKK